MVSRSNICSALLVSPFCGRVGWLVASVPEKVDDHAGHAGKSKADECPYHQGGNALSLVIFEGHHFCLGFLLVLVFMVGVFVVHIGLPYEKLDDGMDGEHDEDTATQSPEESICADFFLPLGVGVFGHFCAPGV